MSRLARTILPALAAAALAGPAAALPFDEWLAELRREALQKGISARILDAAFEGVQPIPRIIELDRKQPEFTLTFRQYMDRVVPESRIEQGRQKLRENREILAEVSSQYRVQPRYIVALWGIETDFGRVTGGFPVVAALATLAHDGRRSGYFRGELMQALRILEEGHIAPEAMMGSWAGAMGQAQFMPSSFVRFAVDQNGDGRRDIWNTRADVLASAANYLHSVGWRDDQTWGRPVDLPPGFDLSLADGKTRKRLDEWQRLGVRRLGGDDLPGRDLQAMLVVPDTSRPEDAFLTYDNYQAILKWNRSTYFALAVGRLSDALWSSE